MAVTSEGEPDPYLIPLDTVGVELLSIDASPGGQGWAAYFSHGVTDSGTLVLLRISPQQPAPRHPDRALEVREVRVVAARHAAGFASSLLREIPILRIEAAVNQSAHRSHLLAHVLADAGNAVAIAHPGGSRYRLPPSQPPSLAPLSPRIDDPGGYRKPDAFYRDVADRYLYQAAISSRPAHALAEANTIPVATVHRWIREAKARGILLLPAHRTDASTPAGRPET